VRQLLLSFAMVSRGNRVDSTLQLPPLTASEHAALSNDDDMIDLVTPVDGYETWRCWECASYVDLGVCSDVLCDRCWLMARCSGFSSAEACEQHVAAHHGDPPPPIDVPPPRDEMARHAPRLASFDRRRFASRTTRPHSIVVCYVIKRSLPATIS
jgi:hypothetical protein